MRVPEVGRDIMESSKDEQLKLFSSGTFAKQYYLGTGISVTVSVPFLCDWILSEQLEKAIFEIFHCRVGLLFFKRVALSSTDPRSVLSNYGQQRGNQTTLLKSTSMSAWSL